MATIEYRRLFRANVILEVEYETTQLPHRKGLFLSSDMSSSGIRVIGAEPFDVGTEFRLKIPINAQKDIIQATSRIIWQKKCQYVPASRKQYYSYGLRFLEMSPQDAILASDFIYEVVRSSNEMEEQELIQKFEELHKSR